MFGHRRTFAAIEADLLTVPADASQIERMSTEHAENAHRAALTDSEQLGVVEQPSAPGLPSGQISKRTKIKRDPVNTALSVARARFRSDTPATRHRSRRE